MPLIEDTQETRIRSDLWATMSLGELSHQQELMIEKMTAITALAAAKATPSVMAMYSALQMGFSDLSKLIDERSTKER